MDQIERSEQAIKVLAASALWYAWGQIDRNPTWGDITLTTEHGQEFGRLFEQLDRDYRDKKRWSRPSVLNGWAEFVRSKQRLGVDAALTVDDLDHGKRYEREDAEKKS